jgi:hypothetical protein
MFPFSYAFLWLSLLLLLETTFIGSVGVDFCNEHVNILMINEVPPAERLMSIFPFSSWYFITISRLLSLLMRCPLPLIREKLLSTILLLILHLLSYLKS